MNDLGNLYDVLGVPHDADTETIRKSFRRKAKVLHPDAGGDAGAFAKLSQAHAVLTVPDKRTRYDRDGTVDDKADNPHVAALALIRQMIDEMAAQVLAQGSGR